MSTDSHFARPIPNTISCLDIGMQASERGDFQLARQMLRNAIENLDERDEKQPRLVELITHIADTYLFEGSFATAQTWYQKALQRGELLQGPNSMQAMCLSARLAHVNCLQSNMSEYQKYFDNLRRAYLLTLEEDNSTLLNILIDLSWALCVTGRADDVRPVNDLIAQIKRLSEEDNLFKFVA